MSGAPGRREGTELSRYFTSLLATGAVVIAGIAPSFAAAMNFGSPPSGEIPILYNDHHVYSTPDRNKQGRVLAALVKNGTILVPLRSMFEAMGATVSWDPPARLQPRKRPVRPCK